MFTLKIEFTNKKCFLNLLENFGETDEKHSEFIFTIRISPKHTSMKGAMFK